MISTDSPTNAADCCYPAAQRVSENGLVNVPSARAAFPFKPRASVAVRPKHILVVDDDPSILFIISRTVTKAGFQTRTAHDGEEGWEAITTGVFDLIITDTEMPRLTGIDMIKRLRVVSLEPPCLLISGRFTDLESNLRKCICPGDVLAKPFSSEALIEKVYSLLLHGDHHSA